MTQREIHHLLWRAGFGPSAKNHKSKMPKTRTELVKCLFSDSVRYTSIPKKITIIEDFKALKNLSDAKRQELIKSSSKNIMDIGLQWVDKMVHSKGQLRERMVLFWHDHFASSAKWDTLIYNQNETLRKHALGSFRDLLKAMCHDAMLLKYLDNQKNNKQHPNENFTRELLELFTLGEGHYTEDDIREGARALTGHAFNFKGEYLFKIGAHDYGSKTFMGETGQFKAAEIIDIILAQKQTAKYITSKIYRYFVNTNVDEKTVNKLAEDFYDSDYDIKKLMQQIFDSDWFYADENMGSKVKSPVDLLVGLMRQCAIEFKQTKVLVVISKILGQVLFFPPNVAGWSIGKQWIDSSTLLFRMRLADFLFLGQKINAKAKDALNAEEQTLDDSFYENNDIINFDFKPLLSLAGNGSKEEQINRLYNFLFQTSTIQENKALQDWIRGNNPSKDSMIMNLFRLPEYQLC